MPKKPRKPLEPWQKSDADRLLALWKKAKEADPKLSQRKFAEDNEIKGGSQAIVWQYVNGHIPLNLENAIKFAKGLGCSVADISPTLEAERRRLVADGGQLPLPQQLSAGLAHQILSLASQLSQEQQVLLLEALEEVVDSNERTKRVLKIPKLRHPSDAHVADALKSHSILREPRADAHRKPRSPTRYLPFATFTGRDEDDE